MSDLAAAPAPTSGPRQRSAVRMSAAEAASGREHVSASGSEEQPLLGRPGDAVQKNEQPIWQNLFLGTAALAQIGSILLVALVYSAIFTHPLVPLFSPHPLLNSFALLLSTQAILILQPTASASQKLIGGRIHGILNLVALAAFAAALIVLVINKNNHNAAHFVSVHARWGLIAYITLAIQTLVGILMFWVPQVFGSVARAKSIWKYHRLSGYALLVLTLGAVAAATSTDYNVNVLHIGLWPTIAASVLVLAGTFPRIRLSKFGLSARRS